MFQFLGGCSDGGAVPDKTYTKNLIFDLAQGRGEWGAFPVDLYGITLRP